MQIICPNCGSKSPIEAGSLMTQTRIVCARCAVEFSAELSDELAANAPSAAAGERGIELYGTTDFAPDSQARPVPVMEVVAAEPAHGTLTAAAVTLAAGIAAATEVAPTVPDAPVLASSDAYEVLSLPEDFVVSGNDATPAGAADVDHLNVLEDVFAAWSQSRGSKPEATSSESARAAEDYVTRPLSDDEAELREGHRPDAEQVEPPSAEWVTAASAQSAEPVGDAAEESAGADDELEPVGAPFADVLPQVAAARSFDGYGLGVRLMRVSPLWLLVSGLSFISLVVFSNWFFVPANVAQAESPRPASRKNDATNRRLAPAASADTATPRPDPPNGGASRAALRAEAEVINASVKVEGPKATATTAPPAPAPTASPVATPKAEQPKAAETAPAPPAPAGSFTVQVGSYSAPAEAEARAASLRSAGQTVRVVGVEIPKRGKWYRVYVGGFGSRGEAESHGKTLRERGLAESYIATEAQ